MCESTTTTIILFVHGFSLAPFAPEILVLRERFGRSVAAVRSFSTLIPILVPILVLTPLLPLSTTASVRSRN